MPKEIKKSEKPNNNKKKKTPFRKYQVLFVVLGVILLFCMLGGGFYSYYQNTVIPDQVEKTLNNNIDLVNSSSEFYSGSVDLSGKNFSIITKINLSTTENTQEYNSLKSDLEKNNLEISKNQEKLVELSKKIKSGPNETTKNQFNLTGDIISNRLQALDGIIGMNKSWVCVSNFTYFVNKDLGNSAIASNKIDIKPENGVLFEKDSKMFENFATIVFPDVKNCISQIKNTQFAPFTGVLAQGNLKDIEKLKIQSTLISKLATAITQNNLENIKSAQIELDKNSLGGYETAVGIKKILDETRDKVASFTAKDEKLLKEFQEINTSIGSKYNLEIQKK